MKSLANRPLLQQVTITLCCIAAGLFAGALSGMISVSGDSVKQHEAELLPTVCEGLSQNQYEMILAQPHSCEKFLYLEDQIYMLEVSKTSMQDIHSEVVLEQLEAIDQAIKNLKKAQRIQLEQPHQAHDH